ncbi:phage tail tape measure protein [Heyndrickxia sporothermodurans]|uniref:phage tail tape measure protein n=1 Tax=Heyndrickxia sporothermodurans TaxID=46224 RepID=UPI0035DFC990
MAKNNHETKVTFKVFNEEFNKAMSEMDNSARKMRKELKLEQEELRLTGTESQKLESKIKGLQQQYDIARQKTQATAEQLAKAKQYFGENSNEANKLENKLLDLKISEEKLSNSIQQAKNDLNKQSKEMQGSVKDAKDLGQALNDAGEKAKDVGGKMTAGVSVPLAGIGLAAGKTAVDIDGAVRLMISSLGATGDEAEQLESDLRAVWTDGFGENPEEAARAMSMVKQNIKGINEGQPIQEVTKDVLALAKVTDSDLSEVTRGVNQLMHNFGITADEAMDLFAKGQAEGLNYSQEMFDNISEYAPLFKQMGFSAEEYFSILANGSQNGAYNLDYINDIMKEFDIRMRDGSKTTSEAFDQMSKSTQSLFTDFKNGKVTSKELFNAVIPELQKMDDQVQANQIGVALFGTKFEDMGAKTVYSLDNTNKSLANTKGAMDELRKTQEESFGTKLQNTIRSIGQALEPIGTILLDMLTSVTPHLVNFANWFKNLSPSIQKIIVDIGGLTAILGPLLAGFGFVVQGIMPFIAGFTKLWGVLSKLGPIFKVVRTAMMALSGPIGIISTLVVALAILIIKNWDSIKSATSKVWNGIKSLLSKVWDSIKSTVSTATTAIKNTVSKVWNSVKSTSSTIWNGIKTVISTVWGGIKSVVSNSINSVKSVVSTVWNSIKSTTSTVWNGIKGVINTVWGGIKTAVSTPINWVKSKVSGVWSSIKTNTSSVWNGIKSAMISPIENARDKIKGIVDRIKSFFSGLKLSLPKIKLPHLSITGGFSIMPPRVPKFSIEWYRKGGIFDEASVIGIGEAGKEAALPLVGKEMNPFADAVANRMLSTLPQMTQNKMASEVTNHNNVTIYANVRNDRDIDKLAEKIDGTLNTLGDRRKAAWGGAN